VTTSLNLRIHIRTVSDKQFGDFLVTVPSRMMQRSHASITLRIHIRTFSDYQFYDFLVTTPRRMT
jgi:predicted component of type VI protein secretion system